MRGATGSCVGPGAAPGGASCPASRRVAARAQGRRSTAPGPSPVRLRVERQTFLPADRADAWAALRSIVPPESWEEQAPVFAAVESVYRAEYQQQAAALQRAYKTTKHLSDPHSDRWTASGGEGSSSSGSDEEGQPGAARQPRRSGADRPLALPHAFGSRYAGQQGRDGGGGEPAAPSSAAAGHQADEHGADGERAEPSTRRAPEEGGPSAEDEAESARREAERADREFICEFVRLLRKANYVPLSMRDEAMAQSLNADYVDQLFISPDLGSLDESLVAPAVEGLEVPSSARAMLVFKRGYGQTRRRGLMLVAKLDYLQYVIVQAVIRNGTSAARRLWRRFRERRATRAAGSGDGKEAREGGGEAELSLWDQMQQAAKQWAARSSDSGTLPPRFLLAGGGLVMTLSNWGLLPQIGVEPIDNFREMRKLDEPTRLSPVFVERVSLRNVLSSGQGLTLQSMLGKIELVEPTFQELVVLYRRVSPPSWLERAGARLASPQQQARAGAQAAAGRQQISMRVYRDIPVPTWKIVFPEKLLQFRPLEGLRADLLTVAGLVALIAQAKYDSTILELITLSSAIVYGSRVFLGYKRMNDRFEQMAKNLLAETMVAGQEPVIDCVAGAAALQQFLEASLAYCLLQQQQQQHGSAADADRLCCAVEELLEERFQVRIRFDAAGTVGELERLGLLSGGALCEPGAALEKLRRRWGRLLQR